MSFELQDSDARARGPQAVVPPTVVQEGASNVQSDDYIPQQLDAADGGFPAWRVLIAGFVFEALLWGKISSKTTEVQTRPRRILTSLGFPISFGVFQEYYSSLPQFAGNNSVALIGTIAQGVCHLGAPFSAALTKRFPRHQRQLIYFAWPLCILGLVAGSFATTINGLIATQGIMYGLGFITLTYPIISMTNEYWIARKGMAFGLISAASGTSGAVMPFIIQALLARYGYKTTLRAIAVAMVVLTGPLLPVFKGRLPPSERSQLAKTNWSFIKKPLFYIFGLSTLMYSLGFFLPALYLPSYAREIGLSSAQGALLLSVMSIAQVLGQFFFGYLSDRSLSVSILCSLCMLISTLAVFSVWGTAKSIGVLLVFSIIWGFFASAYGTMRVAMGRALSDDPSSVVASYSIFVFILGIGNVLGGPISTGLLTKKVEAGEYGIGRYRRLVIFTGTCSFGSAVIIALWWLRAPMKTLQKLVRDA
jgi:MFS family permease